MSCLHLSSFSSSSGLSHMSPRVNVFQQKRRGRQMADPDVSIISFGEKWFISSVAFRGGVIQSKQAASSASFYYQDRVCVFSPKSSSDLHLSPERWGQPWCWSPARWKSPWGDAVQGSWVHVGGFPKRWCKQMSQQQDPPGRPGLVARLPAEPPSRWCRWRCRSVTWGQTLRCRQPPTEEEWHSGPASQPGWKRWCSCGRVWRCRSRPPGRKWCDLTLNSESSKEKQRKIWFIDLN